MTDDLASLTATALRTRLQDGSTTVEAVALACLARVDAREREVHAWSHLDRALVLDRARALDALPASQHGSLHGVPIGVKDIILTADQPTQYNSPLYQGFLPRIDAACVALLRHAGALIFGKTDTVEFGATGRKAATHNPHRFGHTPGGSSSGSAAAVADGHVPLALGTQTGGSMIRPASFCGTWALKPTWGLVGNEGVKRYAVTLDTLGWFARSAEDLRLLLDVLDPDGPVAPRPFTLDGGSIAVFRTAAWDRAGPATRRAMDDAIVLLEAAGVRVTTLDVSAHFDALPDLQMRVMRSEARTSLLAEYRRFPDRLEASLRDQVLNTDGTTHADLLAAYDQAARCRVEFDALAAPFDAVLTPSTVGSAPAGLTDTGDLIYNGLWTLLHTPCVNVPGWRDDSGMPVGLTLTGPRFADRRVLAVAEAFAQLVD